MTKSSASGSAATAPSAVARAEAFVAMHQASELFVLGNPIDVGTAVLLEHLGYPALGTSSAALARSKGRRDGVGAVSRSEAMDHAAEIAARTTIPISGDFENGFGHEPEEVAQTVRDSIEIGLAGCCIEDATAGPVTPIYPADKAAERIRAGAEAIGDAAFVLVARAENHLHGRDDLADTIGRLQSFQEAGATALYAPGLKSLQDIRSVLAEIDLPLNVLIGLSGQDFTLADLHQAGVRRVSIGSGFHREAMAAVQRVATDLLTNGTITPMGVDAPNLDALF